MKSIGLDIGTTTICGILMDAANGELIKKITLPNDSAIEGKTAFEKLQDPKKIEEKCQWIVETLASEAEDLVTIGVTGQMHGIVYLNQAGEAVSPLYSWQDGRGGQIYQDGKTYAETLSEQSGYRLATGFGAVTHYYNTQNQLIPNDAHSFCTIADYIVARLTGNANPVLHISMAASLGMFDLERGRFDDDKIIASGMEIRYFPQVMTAETCVGNWRETAVKVSAAFGDNQASFLGSVNDKSNVLVNVGTGSQVSILGTDRKSFKTLECRPFMENRYLYVGCSLCGGYSYSLLKNFFEDVFHMCNMKEIPDLYEYMNSAGAKAKTRNVEGIKVDTRFRGSRENPSLRGKMEGLSPDNFNAGELVLGVLTGISAELFEFYQEFEGTENTVQKNLHSHITGSGNGIRRNPLLQEIFKEQFGKEMRIPVCAEEASYGSALFSLYSADIYNSLIELQRMVQ